MIYNFSLAPLIVWSLYKGDAGKLTEWSRQIDWVSPHATYLNITATHDGIGMRPTEGILSEAERKELVQLAFDRNGDMTGKRNADGSVAPYELNLSYFDAINDPRHPVGQETEVRKFLVSQAIPIAMMGIPGIYVHSLFGSRNDLEAVKRTGRARSINRAQLRAAELATDLEREGSLRREVFTGIKRLLEARAAHSAFHPDARQEVLSLHPALFAFRRVNPETGESVLALHNVSAETVEIELPEPEAAGRVRDLLTEEAVARHVTLGPYRVRWLLREARHTEN